MEELCSSFGWEWNIDIIATWKGSMVSNFYWSWFIYFHHGDRPIPQYETGRGELGRDTGEKHGFKSDGRKTKYCNHNWNPKESDKITNSNKELESQLDEFQSK